jgi:hypothetical protein
VIRSSQVLALMAMLLAVGVIYLAREIAHGSDLLTVDQKRVLRLEQQLLHLRQQRDEALHELDLASQNLALASPTAVPPVVGNDAARTRAVDSWLAHVKRLKQAFDEHPDQRIPELALLTDLDWLTLARQLQFDSEEDLRKARAVTRDLAFSKFANVLRQALRDYAMAATGAPLSDVFQLVPYFKPSIDAATLERYEIAGPASLSASRDSKTITERAPVDEEFDTRHTVSLDGLGEGSSPWVANFLLNAALDSFHAFSAANNGQPPKSDADGLPYVQDPTAKAIFEAMIAYRSDHHGQEPALTALRPYVNDPAARVLLEKVISAKQNGSGP